MSRRIRVALYSPADLNVIDGSAIWVQAIAETLHVDPDVELTMPLKAQERRDVITRLLRQLDRVELVPAPARGPSAVEGLTNEAALDVLERLDRQRHFDVILLRSFVLCRLAAERPRLRGRLWSAYVLEPEREIRSPIYRADLAAIADASARVLVQSEEMRALYEQLVPAAAERLALLPPAIPDEPAARAPGGIVPRLIYTGKFHPFYPVGELIASFERLHRERPDLSFHVAGDKIHRPPDDPTYAPSLERALMGTPGLVWHGGIGRDEVEALLAQGGIALSVWDRSHGPWMNDLVISTKLLDYCSVGLPVILNRTFAQESLMGEDDPLFVDSVAEVEPLVRRLLADEALYRDAAERCWLASRRFTYSAVHARLAPYLAAAHDPAATQAVEAANVDRPKLPGTTFTVGVVVDRSVSGSDLAGPLELIQRLRAFDDRFRLLVRAGDGDGRLRDTVPVSLYEAVTVEPAREAFSSWLRRVGFVVLAGGREAPRPRARAADPLELIVASGSVPVILDGAPRPTPLADGWPTGSVESVAGQVAALVAG
jgi:glycosyltransferase involved in cell wall biosynthesis